MHVQGALEARQLDQCAEVVPVTLEEPVYETLVLLSQVLHLSTFALKCSEGGLY